MDKQVEAGVKSDHVIRKRSAPQSEEDNSHDDVLSSLSLHGNMNHYSVCRGPDIAYISSTSTIYMDKDI